MVPRAGVGRELRGEGLAGVRGVQNGRGAGEAVERQLAEVGRKITFAPALEEPVWMAGHNREPGRAVFRQDVGRETPHSTVGEGDRVEPLEPVIRAGLGRTA